MAYKREQRGPGGIAALPPTIGSNQRRQWSGMAPLGPRLPSVWHGMGTNGNGNGGGINWLPIGLGLALGGVIFLMITGKQSGGMMSGLALGSAMDSGDYGMMSNPRRQKITVRPYLRKVPGKRKHTKVKGYSYYRR
jgi:hypothetical protein